MSPRLATIFLATLILGTCGTSRREETAGPRPLPPPTFDKDIAPILFEHCATCHRPGEAAPFTVLTYADARPRARAIARATEARLMPPWLPDAHDPPFSGERRLRDDQIDTIQRWADTGAAEGRAADLPRPPTWPDGWQLGTPDLVVTLPRPYVLQPGTHDVYRNVVLPVSIPANRFVRAVEFRTGGAPVHHAVIRVDRTQTSRALDGVDGQPGFDGMVAEDVQDPSGQFLGWAPGRGPIVAPEGMPWRLERDSDLIVELHLLPGKSAVQVQPTLALFFTDKPPTREPVLLIISAKTIDIPAGKPDYVIEESYRLPVDVDLLSVYPHAHYLGKEMDARAVLPGGTVKNLIHIKQWSFHWQQDYQYLTPVALPAGTIISMRYTYDNSEGNRNNPRHPPADVMWGPQSSDEMGTLGLQVLPRSSADAATLAKSISDRQALENVAGAELWVTHDPRSAANQAALGTSYVRVGRFEEAVQHLEEALRLDPRSANAHNYLGGALLGLRRDEDALAHFRRAVALSPRDEHLHFNLAKALDQTGRSAEAIREFGRAIALNPTLADAHQNLGAILFKQGHLPEAIAELQRAAALRPDSVAVHSDLGGALAEAGRFEEAGVELRRALEIDPGNMAARENLSLLERRLGR
jgi:Flp pilus assembly protein TadD